MQFQSLGGCVWGGWGCGRAAGPQGYASPQKPIWTWGFSWRDTAAPSGGWTGMRWPDTHRWMNKQSTHMQSIDASARERESEREVIVSTPGIVYASGRLTSCHFSLMLSASNWQKCLLLYVWTCVCVILPLSIFPHSSFISPPSPLHWMTNCRTTLLNNLHLRTVDCLKK